MRPSAQSLRRSERGMTLLETMIAMAVIAIGVLSALTTLTSSAALDEETTARSIALRAAMSRMEAVLSYDYVSGPEELVAYWTDPTRATFDVDGLAPVGDDAARCGSIAFDLNDASRIDVAVTVAWRGRRGPRSLTLPTTITAIKK